jgi:hypothetical protein
MPSALIRRRSGWPCARTCVTCIRATTVC